MSDTKSATPGQWIAASASWPAYSALGPITKVTAQRVYHPAEHNPKREAFTDFREVLLIGDEATCRLAVDRLNSSLALREQDIAAARQRHQKRQTEIVAKLATSRAADAGHTSGMTNTPSRRLHP